jgi:hypothetical protein
VTVFAMPESGKKSAEKLEISGNIRLTPGGATHMVPRLGARSSVVEHLTFNQRVDGSIPSGLTIYSMT